MSYELTLDLNIHKTDSNRILGVNKYQKHETFLKVKNEIIKLSLGKRPPLPLTSFVIKVTRFSPRFLDFDNLVSSLKPAIDGLKLAKVIKDDSWTYIKHIPVDQVKSKERILRIEVREV